MKFSAATIAAFAASAAAIAPLHTGIKTIPTQYIVALKSDANIDEHLSVIESEMSAISPASEILHKYEIGDFKGYSIRCSPDVLDFIRSNEESVQYVEEDQFMSTYGSQSNPPSWGLDRIDQRQLPLDSLYKYPDAAGSGVNMYTIDTGIRISHRDFGGRAAWGFTANPNASNDDLNGHGTHCSGTMAGTANGVAKSAKLFAVKVLGDLGFGSTSDVIAGVNWVANRHSQSGGKSVGNMSLGGGASSALDQAVNSAVDVGVHMAVAAGNDNSDACNYSPARASKVVCVGATEKTDRKSTFSNHGRCVKIHAPGTDITSAWIGSDTATRTISGTSMASPHVAGVMALYLSRGKVPSILNLQNDSTKGVITGLPTGTINNLLFSDDTLEKIIELS